VPPTKVNLGATCGDTAADWWAPLISSFCSQFLLIPNEIAQKIATN
jgi:hypothetical protein